MQSSDESLHNEDEESRETLKTPNKIWYSDQELLVIQRNETKCKLLNKQNGNNRIVYVLKQIPALLKLNGIVQN